jgi:RimJ/RimL family protein N-acetyltransferase
VRLETKRLILREWREEDRAAYARLHGDRDVRHFYFPQVWTEVEASAEIDKMIAELSLLGFSFLAVERKSDGGFVGEVGLCPIEPEKQAVMHRPASVEVGWVLAKEHWGQGYAREAAQAVIDWTWHAHRFPELVSLIAAGNAQSVRVAEKLGMTRYPEDDFEDPTVPVGHWQRPHVVYRLANPTAS